MSATTVGAIEGRIAMLDRKTYFVRERVAFMKLSDTYDILSLNQDVAPARNILLLAAGLAVDTVFKEKN